MFDGAKIYGIAAAAMVVLIVFVGLLYSRQVLKTALEKEKASVAICESVNKEWGEKSALVNEKVERWQAEARKRDLQVEATMAQAERVNKEREKKMAKVLGVKHSAVGDCEAATHLLNEYVRSYK